MSQVQVDSQCEAYAALLEAAKDAELALRGDVESSIYSPRQLYREEKEALLLKLRAAIAAVEKLV